MNNYRVKVEGEPGLYRDINSGGIVSDDTAYARYKEEKAKKLKNISQEARINKLEADLEQVKTGLNEILSILRNK